MHFRHFLSSHPQEVEPDNIFIVVIRVDPQHAILGPGTVGLKVTQ